LTDSSGWHRLLLVEGESYRIAQGKKEKEKENTHYEQDENMEDW
jgi:hypothetical protein